MTVEVKNAGDFLTVEVKNAGDCRVNVSLPGSIEGEDSAQTPGGQTQYHTLRVHRRGHVPEGVFNTLIATCIDQEHRRCDYDVSVVGVAVAPKKDKDEKDK